MTVACPAGDAALSRARHQGRNHVVLLDDPTPESLLV